MYTEKQLAAVAARENNTKRKYLVVNRFQGKHIPVDPVNFFDMTNALADIVKAAYPNEKLLLIGFAETATAIGAALAVRLDTGYIQTTREPIDGVRWLYFTESHSHATEQKLVRDDIDRVISDVQRIVFVEDEVTTGNTICQIVDIIDKEYGGCVAFSVASLLNGMDEVYLAQYRRRNIGIHYLVKTDHSGYTEIAEKYAGDGQYAELNTALPEKPVEELWITGGLNARRYVRGCEYAHACEKLRQAIRSDVRTICGNSVLVLGTEEFMYPALYLADQLRKDGYTVRCHATTRSPIAVSSEEDYPLHCRYELASLYDADRTTYLYDIGTYNTVLILTDSADTGGQGVHSLVNALRMCGNEDIRLIRWKYN